jgi:hypothetical protein
MSLNILNKVNTLEILIKETRDSLNSQKVRKENKNDANEKKIHELLLKQESQNEWDDEFLILKKELYYNEEYLKEKEFEDDKRKHENGCMKAPYIRISSVNVENNTNKNVMVPHEKLRSKTRSIHLHVILY